ncbi:MAG: TIGR03905 family TSCPD domain-containing protein [Lachnospirales bacterium]
MSYIYETNSVCAKTIKYDLEDGKVYNVEFTGGCNGNLKAIANLLEGLTVDEVITKCEGITCGPRDTSCTDQLVKSLKEQKNS